jgi:hypothetical protein
MAKRKRRTREEAVAEKVKAKLLRDMIKHMTAVLTDRLQNTADTCYNLLLGHYKPDSESLFQLCFMHAVLEARQHVHTRNTKNQVRTAKWKQAKGWDQSYVVQTAKTIVQLTSAAGKPDHLEIKLSDPETRISMITPKGMVPSAAAPQDEPMACLMAFREALARAGEGYRATDVEIPEPLKAMLGKECK